MMFLYFILAFTSVLYCFPPASLLKVHIWPEPKDITTGTTKLYLYSKSFKVTTKSTNQDLIESIDRFTKRIFYHSDISTQGLLTITELIINVKYDDTPLLMGHNESYSLDIPKDGSAIIITSDTIYGAYYGLETLSQIITYSYEENHYIIESAPYAIFDEPQYSYRLLMIDTSRHYLPISFIYTVIDSMTYTKLNVLHWHITDDQAQPMQSSNYPKFWDGSFTEYERYTIDEMDSVVTYAKKRGIRVVPELDTPGHASSFCTGYPELCPSTTCKSPLDPTKDFTFEFLKTVFEELNSTFPDDYVHLGGDEVDTSCWKNTQHIADWMASKSFTVNDAYYYFVDNVIQMIKNNNKNPVVWEEVFNSFGTKLDKSTVVHVWLPGHRLNKAVEAGYRGILSNADPWYLPRNYTWTDYYKNSITNGIPEEQRHLILGGGPAMWGEYVDPSDFMNSVWPRAAAAAEPLWTPEAKLNVTTAENRFRYFRCLLIRRDIGAGVVNGYGPRIKLPGPGSCYTQ